MLNFVQFALLGFPLLAFVQFNPFLPGWGSRKALHMGMGTLLILCDMNDWLIRASVYAASAIVCGSAQFMRPLHFAEVRDPGITSYLCFVSMCVACGIPLSSIAPLFYADPSGAIVGRNVDSPKLVGSKSAAGTLAVATVAALTLFGVPWPLRAFHGIVLALIELFGGKWDNPLMGTYLVLIWIAG